MPEVFQSCCMGNESTWKPNAGALLCEALPGEPENFMCLPQGGNVGNKKSQNYPPNSCFSLSSESGLVERVWKNCTFKRNTGRGGAKGSDDGDFPCVDELEKYNYTWTCQGDGDPVPP